MGKKVICWPKWTLHSNYLVFYILRILFYFRLLYFIPEESVFSSNYLSWYETIHKDCRWNRILHPNPCKFLITHVRWLRYASLVELPQSQVSNFVNLACVRLYDILMCKAPSSCKQNPNMNTYPENFYRSYLSDGLLIMKFYGNIEHRIIIFFLIDSMTSFKALR